MRSTASAGCTRFVSGHPRLSEYGLRLVGHARASNHKDECDERRHVGHCVVDQVEKGDREQLRDGALSLAEDAAGPIGVQREVLRELEHVLELVPHLEREREGQETSCEPTVLVWPIPMQAEKNEDCEQQPEVERVVDEMDRLNVGQAPD